MQVQIQGHKVWLNLHHLYYFYVIENNGSLAKASDELKVGVSTLSAQLSQFEENLGVELFERKNNRLKLTTTGRIVYGYAEKIFKLGQELIESINLPERKNVNSLNVGFFNGVPKNVTIDICKNLRNNGGYEVNIIRGHSEKPLEELEEKRLDVILINHPLTLNERTHFYMKKIASSPVIICGHKKYKKLISDFPGSLTGEPFLMPLHNESLKNGLEHFFIKNDIQVEMFGSSEDITLQKAVAVDGMSLIAAPLTSVQDHLYSGELIQIGNTGLKEEFYLVSSKKLSDHPIFKDVILKLES